MCGIVGCFGVKDTETIDRMLDALPHRGPDDRGMHVFDGGVFGHTRLSIVDVAKGHQPILADGGEAGIICNGEVYNHRDIRRRLLSNYTFTTDSDSETILHLYRKAGPACIRDLDGMFGFAIFADGTYMLARDPIGIKPLYYGYVDGNMYVSSELKAMSFADVDHVLEFPPGHYFTPDEGFVQYYTVPPIQQHMLSDIDEACEAIRRTFTKSVNKRLLSDRDVTVGAFCSGGLDSSLVAAIAAETIPDIHTFAVGMKDKDGNESDDLRAARIVAGHIESTHHEYVFTEEEYYEALPVVIEKLETYDPSLVRCAVPCYFTCKCAAPYATVVLTGEGADEIFAGYQYMKTLPPKDVNPEAIHLLQGVHNINLQRADRMGMAFSLELRVPFFDAEMIDLAMKIPPQLKIREQGGNKIEKWILRKAFENSGYLPNDVLWRYKVQYTQGAGCQDLGEKLAERELSDGEYAQIRTDNPDAEINSKEAAYYFKIFRTCHPQDSILDSISVWPGFSYDVERKKVSGTIE